MTPRPLVSLGWNPPHPDCSQGPWEWKPWACHLWATGIRTLRRACWAPPAAPHSADRGWARGWAPSNFPADAGVARLCSLLREPALTGESGAADRDHGAPWGPLVTTGAASAPASGRWPGPALKIAEPGIVTRPSKPGPELGAMGSPSPLSKGCPLPAREITPRRSAESPEPGARSPLS